MYSSQYCCTVVLLYSYPHTVVNKHKYKCRCSVDMYTYKHIKRSVTSNHLHQRKGINGRPAQSRANLLNSPVSRHPSTLIFSVSFLFSSFISRVFISS